jgi:hypothetical protein
MHSSIDKRMDADWQLSLSTLGCTAALITDALALSWQLTGAPLCSSDSGTNLIFSFGFSFRVMWTNAVVRNLLLQLPA